VTTTLANLVIDSQTLEASLVPLISNIRTALVTPNLNNTRTAVESAVSTAADIAAFTADVLDYSKSDPLIFDALKTSGILGLLSASDGIVKDASLAKEYLDNNQPVPNQIWADIGNNSVAFSASAAQLYFGGAEKAGVALGIAATLNLASAAMSGLLSFSSAPAPGAIVTPGPVPAPSQVAFANGNQGAWTNNNDGTSTFEISNASGTVLNAITITTPTGALPTITSAGGTVNSDSGDLINVSNTGAISETHDGNTAPISQGSEVLLNSIVVMNVGSDGKVTGTDTNSDGSGATFSAQPNSTGVVDQTSENLSQAEGAAYGVAPQSGSETYTLNNGDLTGSATLDGSTFNITNPLLVAGSGQTYNASQLSDPFIVDLSGGNTLTTGGATGVTLVGAVGDTLQGANDQATLMAMGSNITVTSTGDTVSVNGSGIVVDGNTNAVNVEGVGSTVDAIGGGNTINGGADEGISISGTDGGLDTLNVSGDVGGATLADGSQSGIFLACYSVSQVF
jgi:hypothetical protein